MVEGLLYSQIGYDLGMPMRAAVCGEVAQLRDGTFSLRSVAGRLVAEGPLHAWGRRWGRDWWIADFSRIAVEGAYKLDILKPDGRTWRSAQVQVGKDLLWKQTFRHVALEQARKRAIFAAAKVGWFDAGMSWQEANSHCSFIIGLTDVLEFAAGKISDAERKLVEQQIINGCQYLALCQDRAAELNHPAGSLSHEVPKYETIILPHDACKAVVAWARASRLLGSECLKEKQDYLQRARKAFSYVSQTQPSRVGFSGLPRGVADDFQVPDQWATRDLVVQLWGALELAMCGLEQYRDDFTAIARVVLQRQIPHEQAEDKYFGHFYEFSGCGYSEKAWTHSLVNKQWGIDAGATFPNYILPLIRACELWHDHPDVQDWRKAVQQFAYGYFQPACEASPFHIMPLGYFPGQGIINFAGLWHGMNAVYGLSAALAIELSHFLEDRSFLEIAVGNLQWIAGLNVGVTRESLAGCVMFDMDIPEGEALPASMIFGVGQRCAGGWTTMRGSICNGFAVGEQFKFDLAPTMENDAKITLTDEDWITHCGGWLSGLSRLASL